MQADMISDYEGSQGEEMNHDKLKYERLPIKTKFSKAKQKDFVMPKMVRAQTRKVRFDGN